MNGIRMNPIKLQQICSEMDAWQKLRGVWEVRVFLGVFGCLAIDGSAVICVRSSGKNHSSHRLVKQKRRLEQRTWLRSCSQVENNFTEAKLPY